MIHYISTAIPDVWELQPDIYKDARGGFAEMLRFENFYAQTSCHPFVQQNESFSKKGVLRGMHLQYGKEYAQAKLVRCSYGQVIDVVLDLRPESSTFKQYVAILLDAEKRNQLFVPRGFAHGFLTLSQEAYFTYLVDNYYFPQKEVGLNPFDKDLAIDWLSLISNLAPHTLSLEVKDFILSEKDKNGISLEKYLNLKL